VAGGAGADVTELELHRYAAFAEIGFGLFSALALMFISAPYGRHGRDGWGPQIPARVGWILMEVPACLGFLAVYLLGGAKLELVPLVLLGMWQLHYVYRTFVFPFLIRAEGKTMPLVIALMAVVFNGLNAYVNARWISHLGTYETSWLTDPRFLLGAVVFCVGMTINHRADATLRGLREPGETGYKIPQGFLYRRISCPNYFGEILEWIGWAIATWSLAGVAFVVFTAGNLVPRALEHHRWYQETFEDYPKERKALLPFVL
jgi:protein-S-isoprenylcysteine O-methyltransferase Ste14